MRGYLTGAVLSIALLATGLAACGQDQQQVGPGVGNADGQTLTIYSGRNENLVDPIIRQFEAETGITVRVRYAGTAELAAMILEEGNRSPADLFFAQDAGALGAVAHEGMFLELPDSVLEQVDPRFRDPAGYWVGITGRARVVAYNTERVDPSDLPDSIMGFTDPAWHGRIGWPPTNGSFQANITAVRVAQGEDWTRDWLEGILANEPREYPNNTTTVEAVGRGEVDVGFVNHYYLHRLKSEFGDEFPVENHYLRDGDPGALVNIAGAGILASSPNAAAAEQFLAFLLSEEGQTYFAGETFEFPLVTGIDAADILPGLEELEPPDIDLSDLWDLQRTLELLHDVGAL